MMYVQHMGAADVHHFTFLLVVLLLGLAAAAAYTRDVPAAGHDKGGVSIQHGVPIGQNLDLGYRLVVMMMCHTPKFQILECD
jgi:hypothetical protein